MTAPTTPSARAAPMEPARPRRRVPDAVMDAIVTAAWFAVSGLVGAVVWWQVVDLPSVTKTGDAAALDPTELVTQVAVDGWYFVVAVVGGMLGGVVLLAWRRRDPLLMVVLVVLGGGLAAWLMLRVGLALGPGDELTALRGRPDGTAVRVQLELQAIGMAWIWPMSAAFGALVQLWVLRKPDTSAGDPVD